MKIIWILLILFPFKILANYAHEPIQFNVPEKCSGKHSSYGALRIEWDELIRALRSNDERFMRKVVPNGIRNLNSTMVRARERAASYDFSKEVCSDINMAKDYFTWLNKNSELIAKLYSKNYYHIAAQDKLETDKRNEERKRAEETIKLNKLAIEELEGKRAKITAEAENINSVFKSHAPIKELVIISEKLNNGLLLGTYKGEIAAFDDQYEIVTEAGAHYLELEKSERFLSRKLNNGFTNKTPIYEILIEGEEEFKTWKNTKEAKELKERYDYLNSLSSKILLEIKNIK
ncbi:MAG: hypothetical protein ACTH4U_19005 [Pseudoalteromonas prydzensis]|uniref:hypothetical protein n=1 Tax=Pseudoalteromonas prydzensis TaxID=182141 RepID=UPI003F9D6638